MREILIFTVGMLTDNRVAFPSRQGNRISKRLFLIVVLVCGLLFSLEAQSGGRKREGKAKRRGSLVLNQYKSRGHADEFAKGNSGRRGFFSRLFRRERPAWTNRSTGSSRSNYKENRFLFSWNRTKGKGENVTTLDRQNKERAKNRNRGNKSFKSKKYKRKK